jgi:hypothetical protein
MKSERITVVVAPELKSRLARAASKAGISLAECVRQRVALPTPAEHEALTMLAAEIKRTAGEARRSLRGGLAELDKVLDELAAKRSARASARPGGSVPRLRGAARTQA